MVRRIAIFTLMLSLAALAANADGLAVNLPLVGRVTGAGGTLYITAVDVTNNNTAATQVDFYFTAINLGTNEKVAIAGSVSSAGIVSRGQGTMAAFTNQHFDDFVHALVIGNFLPSDFESDGVTGSLLLVFNGATKRGQGIATARFVNSLAGGYVGVGVNGHEIVQGEPQKIVATVRDTRGNSALQQIYPNLFLNNTGLTPSGAYTADAVTVRLSAVSARTGQQVGNTLDVAIPSGLTVSVGQTFQALGISNASEDTIIVTANVISGSAAIEGLVSQVDPVTKDSSAFEMTRADF